jgi:hypothetical protein
MVRNVKKEDLAPGQYDSLQGLNELAAMEERQRVRAGIMPIVGTSENHWQFRDEAWGSRRPPVWLPQDGG